MMLVTEQGEFPIPDAVDARLPSVPDEPHPNDPDYRELARQFDDWLASSPYHMINYERLKRWRLVQGDLVRDAVAAGRPVVITADGLD